MKAPAEKQPLFRYVGGVLSAVQGYVAKWLIHGEPSVILISTLGQDDLVEHPDGGYSFGVMPAVPHLQLPEGDIYLRRGIHYANKGNGYGVEHIWAAHEYDLKKDAYTIIESVADYVAHIIEPGTPVYFDSSRAKKGRPRATVLRSSFGLVIVELQVDSYFVVTAYPNRYAAGTLIGKTK